MRIGQLLLDLGLNNTSIRLLPICYECFGLLKGSKMLVTGTRKFYHLWLCATVATSLVQKNNITKTGYLILTNSMSESQAYAH
jgi:hypothetical protein